MSSTELTQWQAYEQVTGPLGAERLDHLLAVLGLRVIQASGTKKRLKVSDFLPRWDTSTSWERSKKALAGWLDRAAANRRS